MKKILKIVFQVLLFVFPWPLRRVILNFTFGYRIERKSKIGFSVVIAEKVHMRNGSKITHLTFINNIDKLDMDPHSKIGGRNWITGANTSAKMFNDSDRECILKLGEHTRITGQHHIDCTGGVYIKEFTTIAGLGSQILSHSIDVKISKQIAGPVQIGSYCFIGTSSIILMGAALPDYCILGAGAVLNKSHEIDHSLYAGNPARHVKKLSADYKYFKRSDGHVG